MLAGFSVEEIFALTNIDPWFLRNIEQIVAMEKLIPTQTSDVLLADIPEAERTDERKTRRPERGDAQVEKGRFL